MPLFGRPSRRDDARAAGWASWAGRQHPLALTSLVLGVFSLTHFGTLVVDGVAAVVLGLVAMRQLRTARNADVGRSGNGPAWVGLLTGGVSLLMALVLYTIA